MTNKTPVEIEIIPGDAIIDVKISGDFLSRLNSFITDFFPYKDKDHYLQLVKDLKDNTNQEDPFVYHFKTLIALQAHVEMEAKAQNKTKKVKIDPETGEPIPEENPQKSQS